MDTYQRKPREWRDTAKGITDQPNPGQNSSKSKTPIQLARERHAQKHGKSAPQQESNKPTPISAHG